jgi:hypothetical protein
MIQDFSPSTTSRTESLVPTRGVGDGIPTQSMGTSLQQFCILHFSFYTIALHPWVEIVDTRSNAPREDELNDFVTPLATEWLEQGPGFDLGSRDHTTLDPWHP